MTSPRLKSARSIITTLIEELEIVANEGNTHLIPGLGYGALICIDKFFNLGGSEKEADKLRTAMREAMADAVAKAKAQALQAMMAQRAELEKLAAEGKIDEHGNLLESALVDAAGQPINQDSPGGLVDASGRSLS